MAPLWSDVKGPIFSLTAREVQLGLSPEGTTCYFSANCTKEDADIVREFLVAQVRCCQAAPGVILL